MEQTFKRISLWLAAMLCTFSVLVFVGWQYRIPLLRGQLAGSFVAPNAALCFFLCSLSIFLQFIPRQTTVFLGRLFGAFVGLFAGAVFCEYLFRVDFGIDRIFFAHRLSDWYLPMPGRFALNSAIGFMLAGTALVTLRRRKSPPIAETAALAVLLLSYLSLIGYLYSVRALYASGSVMSVITAVWFALLAVALGCAASRRALLDVASSPFAGGIVSRRMITAIVVIMPLLGSIDIKVRDSGYISREFSISLLVLMAVVIFSSLTLRTAATLNELDRQRRKVEIALRSSEHQQAESLQEIKLHLKRLQLVEDALNAGTWEFDVRTGVSHWGPGISSLWGLPRKEHDIALDDFASRIHPEDRDRVMQVVQSALASGDSYEVEFRVIWPDESIHWLGARGAVLRNELGKPTKIIGIALEVTQRHQTEKALRDSEKLAATGRLAATIAHEINNPLEAVVNLVYLAKSNPQMTPELRRLLDTADVELARVSHMVRQTLGFYRESSNPVWVDLSEMVLQVVALYRNKMQRKNVKIDVSSQTARVYGFEGELRQVISNLISNAIDAVSLDGQIRIRVRLRNAKVQIVVADDGHGIAPEYRARIFQPFFTTKKDVGTGLGLWVSKGIIDKHNGKVRLLTSTRNKRSGTIFCVELPVQSIRPAAQSATLAS